MGVGLGLGFCGSLIPATQQFHNDCNDDHCNNSWSCSNDSYFPVLKILCLWLSLGVGWDWTRLEDLPFVWICSIIGASVSIWLVCVCLNIIIENLEGIVSRWKVGICYWGWGRWRRGKIYIANRVEIVAVGTRHQPNCRCVVRECPADNKVIGVVKFY